MVLLRPRLREIPPPRILRRRLSVGRLRAHPRAVVDALYDDRRILAVAFAQGCRPRGALRRGEHPQGEDAKRLRRARRRGGVQPPIGRGEQRTAEGAALLRLRHVLRRPLRGHRVPAGTPDDRPREPDPRSAPRPGMGVVLRNRIVRIGHGIALLVLREFELRPEAGEALVRDDGRHGAAGEHTGADVRESIPARVGHTRVLYGRGIVHADAPGDRVGLRENVRGRGGE
mmetsp:Transcript_4896/g.12291  ORF Transcript_4896/g.12291 Transcript_4896/m.12291 type:complete len:229 (-) Transcript_4896:1242-1928(-)